MPMHSGCVVQERTVEGVDSITSVLRIVNVRDADLQVYNCTAKNQYGIDSATVHLRQNGTWRRYI